MFKELYVEPRSKKTCSSEVFSSKASNVGIWTTKFSFQTLTVLLMMSNPVAPIGIMEIMQKVYTV